MLLGEGVQWPWARLSGSLLEGRRALGCISEGPGSWTVLLPNRQIASPPFLQVNQNNSLKSVLYMSSAFAEIQTSAALKTKMQNHCSLWKKWLHNGDRGQFSDKGGCSPKSDHVDSSLLCSTWCQADLGAAETGLASASEKGCWCLQPMTESFCWLLPQQEHYSHPQSHTRNVTCSLRSWRKIESSVIGRKKCFTFEMFPNGCSLFHLQEWLCLFHPHLIITSFTNIFIFHTWKIVHEW